MSAYTLEPSVSQRRGGGLRSIVLCTQSKWPKGAREKENNKWLELSPRHGRVCVTYDPQLKLGIHPPDRSSSTGKKENMAFTELEHFILERSLARALI